MSFIKILFGCRLWDYDKAALRRTLVQQIYGQLQICSNANSVELNIFIALALVLILLFILGCTPGYSY